MFRQLLLFVHLTSVIIWVGGMFFAYFCLRPAAARLLDPPQRLPLWVETFRSFFRITAVAVALLLVSGLTMFFELGFRAAPLGWHVMLALGLVMAGIFAHVYAQLYPRLRSACAASNWPTAGATLNRIRQMVALNLVLSLLTVAAALLLR